MDSIRANVEEERTFAHLDQGQGEDVVKAFRLGMSVNLEDQPTGCVGGVGCSMCVCVCVCVCV